MPALDPAPGGLARLVARVHVGGGMQMLTFAPEPNGPPTHGHTRPGQYAEVRLAAGSGFFVIASVVGAPAWQFVLRGGGDAADALLTWPIGGVVEMSGALGDGFPCEESHGRPLMLAMSGTGIAAARPVIAWRLAEGDAARTELLFGLRTHLDLPLATELAGWRARGVDVTLCVSQGDEAPDEPNVVRGYVQDVARSRLTEALRAGQCPIIFAAGSDAMVAALRAMAPALGVPEVDVRTNY